MSKNLDDVIPVFYFEESLRMESSKKIKLCSHVQKTFQEGFEEYILDCKSRNLRDGTIRHYQEAIKQIYKRIPPETMIADAVPQAVVLHAASAEGGVMQKEERFCTESLEPLCF